MDPFRRPASPSTTRGLNRCCRALTSPNSTIWPRRSRWSRTQTCAVLVEAVQAEGGIHAATGEFLTGLRCLCDEREMLLVFDEIQVGCGRLGSLWAYQQYEVEPDIMTLAKALGGGLPIGVALLRQKVADAIEAGDHAATFGAQSRAAPRRPRSWASCWSPGFIAGVREKRRIPDRPPAKAATALA